ncbi:BamA/TamA family outer membrane protein [Flavitalea sp.]|nr:BamA/TamA family outer membrane protein [Flavitalea sp.]
MKISYIYLIPTWKSICITIMSLSSLTTVAQTDSTSHMLPDTSLQKKAPSKFDQFNKKAEHFFKIFPAPIITYSPEAGNIFGLAKNNIFELSKKDTISKPSKLSEVVTFSTKGRINFSVSTELIFKENKYMILAYFNYRKQPEYIFGIGNDVTREGVEEVEAERIKFFATNLVRVKKSFYVGVPIDISSYFNVKTDSNSFLIKDKVSGLKGGFTFGTGLAAVYDNRLNRYNPTQGGLVMAVLVTHPEFLSEYEFTHFELDLRKYFNPWLKHVIALQATTNYNGGNTPFYELSMMGGDKQMRGYYQGAYRDKVLVDAQFEYRAPVWNIFGLVGWVGTGRVADKYSNLTLDGWKLSYGAGLRIRVDTKHNTNLRLDFGFGPNGIKGTYFSFAEAF